MYQSKEIGEKQFLFIYFYYFFYSCLGGVANPL